MANVTLLQHRISEYHFVNKVTEQGQLKMGTSFSFNVSFEKDNSRCVAYVRQIIKEENDKLSLALSMSGLFACEGVESDEGKKAVHAMCYDQLFPYLQSTVQTLMQSGGVPGFMLRKAVINKENVQVSKGQDRNGAKPTLPIV